jgi:hypothetical protein
MGLTCAKPLPQHHHIEMEKATTPLHIFLESLEFFWVVPESPSFSGVRRHAPNRTKLECYYESNSIAQHFFTIDDLVTLLNDYSEINYRDQLYLSTYYKNQCMIESCLRKIELANDSYTILALSFENIPLRNYCWTIMYKQNPIDELQARVIINTFQNTFYQELFIVNQFYHNQRFWFHLYPPYVLGKKTKLSHYAFPDIIDLRNPPLPSEGERPLFYYMFIILQLLKRKRPFYTCSVVESFPILIDELHSHYNSHNPEIYQLLKQSIIESEKVSYLVEKYWLGIY